MDRFECYRTLLSFPKVLCRLDSHPGGYSDCRFAVDVFNHCNHLLDNAHNESLKTPGVHMIFAKIFCFRSKSSTSSCMASSKDQLSRMSRHDSMNITGLLNLNARAMYMRWTEIQKVFAKALIRGGEKCLKRTCKSSAT